jgi:chemotaxis protein MotB
MARRMTVGVCGVLIALFATGCTSPDQIQIETLQKKVQDLDAENANLRERLAKALADRDAARAEARALRQQLDALNQQPMEKGPTGWVGSGPYAWTSLGTDFLFASGQATLRAEGRAKLAQVVSEIQANFPEKSVWVLGHTDTDPIKYTKDKWKDNLDLSANRAMTVYRELMKLGITPERMIAGGQGEFFPRAGNNTKAGKQENRRVEIIVVPPRPAVGTPLGPAEMPKTGPETGSAALVPVPKE